MTHNGFTKNHNSAVVFTSTLLADVYQSDFEQMWSGTFSTKKTAAATTTLLYEGQELEIYFSPKSNAIEEIIAEVNSATDSIEFAIFFFTDDDLRDALIDARARGVTVRGIWDLLGASNAFSEDEALCEGGIPIKTEDTKGKMHNKFMVIDPQGADPRVITGSMNWTGAGNNRNDENTIIFHEGATAAAYAEAFDAMWQALAPSTQCEVVTVAGAQLFLPLIIQPGSALPPPPPPADVQLVRIVYNPDGSDIEGELVEIANRGGHSQQLDGWTLQDESSNIYTFPNFILEAGQSVRVWVRNGSDTENDLYWGRNSAVWNNTGDSALLVDSHGGEIDICGYSGGEIEALCD